MEICKDQLRLDLEPLDFNIFPRKAKKFDLEIQSKIEAVAEKIKPYSLDFKLIGKATSNSKNAEYFYSFMLIAAAFATIGSNL